MATGKFYAFVKKYIGALVKLFFRIRVVGRENIPENGGYILCCNHTHFMDVVWLVIAFPHPICFMAKQELFKNKFIAKILKIMGAFPVARGTGTGGTTAIHTAEKLVNDGNVLGIFPEGTRNPHGRPKAAKSGVVVIASSTGADIVPTSIYYEGKLTLFKKITLNIGPVIPKEELKMEEANRTELKRVASHIMGKITSQWEAGHCE